MAFNYESYLTEKINNIANELGIETTIYIGTEQAFAKMKEIKPDSIFAIIKYLSSSEVYQVRTQPVQIMILSEENQLHNAQSIFGKFAKDYNLRAETIDTTYLKQVYTSPVVMSNFNQVKYGKRSLLYMGGNLYLMEGIIDITNFTIDEIPITPLNLQINYSMTGNTQPVGDSLIAKTEKNISSLGINFDLPFLSKFIKRDSDYTEISNGIEGRYNIDGVTYRYKFENAIKPYQKIFELKGYNYNDIPYIEKDGYIYAYTSYIPPYLLKIYCKFENNLVYEFLSIMKGVESGNKTFIVSFNAGDIPFIDVPMKLVNCPIGTTPDSPSTIKISLLE